MDSPGFSKFNQNESGYISSDEVQNDSKVLSPCLKSDEECSPFKKSPKVDVQGSKRDEKSKMWPTPAEHMSLQILVKLGEKAMCTTMCQTNGRETVLDMVKRYNDMNKPKKSTAKLIFKNIQTGCAINLGLPTGMLKQSKEYQCIFKDKLEYNTETLKRDFDVGKFDSEEWKIKSFFIKFDSDRTSKPNVCQMSRVASLFEVPYFEGEAFYDALCQDGRFDVKNSKGLRNLCKCILQESGSQIRIPLENDASPHDGKTFELYYSKACITREVKVLKCPQSLRTQPIPELSPQKLLPLTAIRVEGCSVPNGGLSQDLSSLIEVNKSAKMLVIADEEFKCILERAFDFRFEKGSTKAKETKRRKRIKKIFMKDYFALQTNFQLGKSHLLKLIKLIKCTGAVVIQLASGIREFMGTCFRIGPNYVMTNNHVVEAIENAEDMLQYLYVDFAYTGGKELSSLTFTGSEVVVQSEELDYAVIKLDKPKDRGKLPPSVTYTFTIPNLHGISPPEGRCLTFAGHPEGSNETVTDLLCPLKNPESIDSKILIGLSKYDEKQLMDSRRTTYDVSTFFYGSSGSPGVLLHEGFLVMLHCRKYDLNDGLGGTIEQGVQIAAIVKDVQEQRGFNFAREMFDLPEVAPSSFQFNEPEPMIIDTF